MCAERHRIAVGEGMSMRPQDRHDMNQQVVEEFRANRGEVGGPFQGAPLLLLHHVGRKTGIKRVTPLVYQPVGGAWAIFASKAGAPTHPEWYVNLMATPRTTIEVGAETIPVVARTATGTEREAIWDAQKKAMPRFADYEVKAGTRSIPVVVLERIN